MSRSENDAMNEWLALATKGIRFGADRRIVCAELQEHIEDKIFDLRRLYPDMTKEAAIQRALRQMGDAREIGRELGKIHTPWLGYLWRLSQAVLVLVCLYIGLQVWGGVDLWPGFGPTSFYSTGEGVERYMEKRFPGPYNAQPLELELPKPVQTGDYTISITRAELWGSAVAQADWQYERELYLVFQVEYDRPWQTPAAFIDSVWAQDDLGNRVLSKVEWDNWDSCADEKPAYTKFGSMTYKGVQRCTYDIVIPVSEWQAKRLYINYRRMGADISFELDLTGGAL